MNAEYLTFKILCAYHQFEKKDTALDISSIFCKFSIYLRPVEYEE